MKEKLTIFIILLVTVIGIFIAWLWLQNIIEEYDLDTAPKETVFERNQAYTITS